MIDVLEVTLNADGTAEVIQRPFTDEEINQRKADQKADQEAAQAAEREATLRESARDKIAAASGLTPEEMRALGFPV